jgi:hypothetical protein
MTIERAGGLAGLVCAATYLIGFALLVTLLAPLGFGSADIDAAGVVAFTDARPGILIAWNTAIYIVNALALAVLVVALRTRLSPVRPGLADVSLAFGLIWAALVLAAGMLANVAVERAAVLYPTDPAAAADLWATLHAVELGLGGGNASWHPRGRCGPRHDPAAGGRCGRRGLWPWRHRLVHRRGACPAADAPRLTRYMPLAFTLRSAVRFSPN